MFSDLTQPNQFLHWAIVPPGSAMCSHEEQSSFILLSCPVPWFVCEPMLWSLVIAQVTGQWCVLKVRTLDQTLLELFSKLRFPAGVGASEYLVYQELPGAKGQHSIISPLGLSGGGISGSSHPLTAHSAAWSQVSVPERSALNF